MSMKMKSISGRVFTQNQRIFDELCVLQTERFLLRLMNVRAQFGLPKIKEVVPAMQIIGDSPTPQDWLKLKEIISNCTKNRLIFNKSLDKESWKLFNNLIAQIISDNSLGEEWKNPLIDVVINGFFMPPIHDLTFEPNQPNKTLSLTLNADTTLEDIKSIWSLIESVKTNAFGNSVKKNRTDKSVDNLITLAKMKIIQNKHPELKGTGILEELYPEMENEEMNGESDRKETNRLRQIKSRMNRRV